jgi:hypothetical protein
MLNLERVTINVKWMEFGRVHGGQLSSSFCLTSLGSFSSKITFDLTLLLLSVSMNFFWSLCYFLQIVSILPLIQVYIPSCASLYIKDVAIANGDSYYFYSNFLGNTFQDTDLLSYATTFWYGFTRNDIFRKNYLLFLDSFLTQSYAMKLNHS